MKTLIKLFGMVAACAWLGPVSAQVELSKPIPINGIEIPLSEVPEMKGRWYFGSNQASQVLRFSGGTVYIWARPSCGEDQVKLVKAYRDKNILTFETGPSKDQIRCNIAHGGRFVLNTDTKKGFMGFKTAADATEVLATFRMEVD